MDDLKDTSQYSEDHQQFISDMKEAGFEVGHYKGRLSYEGPAVRCDDAHSVSDATDIKCVYDLVQDHFVVYPKQSPDDESILIDLLIVKHGDDWQDHYVMGSIGDGGERAYREMGVLWDTD